MNSKFKNILITGASSGIGAALAEYYAQNGAENLFICGRNTERLQKTADTCEKYGVKVHSEIMNVTDKEKIAEWIEKCNQQAPLNLVIANAGVSTGQETTENIYQTFSTNIFGVLNTIHPALDIYKSRNDNSQKAIAILASIAGYHGLAACPSYSASKACVKAYGEALRAALGKEKIQISVICPGFVKSRITDKNTCPMPFFMSAEKAAKIIASRLERNVGLIAFPWPMRFASWFISILPNFISNCIYSKLPHKV
ncbi:MAG: SDR family NAD(P)-dependent oxidoreductase [Alphaproteobacteria bacterium]|nr:SDR family NAD(P)-dependent oxidoreductase [Alphaproteobacteria bacterium]